VELARRREQNLLNMAQVNGQLPDLAESRDVLTSIATKLKTFD
jgi:hypothetical protein